MKERNISKAEKPKTKFVRIHETQLEKEVFRVLLLIGDLTPQESLKLTDQIIKNLKKLSNGKPN